MKSLCNALQVPFRRFKGLFILSVLISSSIFAQVKKPVQKAPAKKHTIIAPKLKDREPQYPGGLDSMKAFLKRNLKYPQTELYNETAGTVIVKAVVREDGSLTNLSIDKSVSKDVDAEAIRIVQIMPKWIPGVQNGKKVPMVMKLPLHFSVN